MNQLVAVWYVGLFVFAINGLIWIGHANKVREHKVAADRVSRVVLKFLRKRGVR